MRSDTMHGQPLLTYSEKAKAYAREQRRYPTLNERRVWQRLRRRQLSVYFRRQAPVGRYIVDFLCVEAMLVLEIDGPHHLTEEARMYDARRDRRLQEKGLKIMRFTDEKVSKDLHGIIERVEKEVRIRIRH